MLWRYARDYLFNRIANCLLCLAPCPLTEGICRDCLTSLPRLGLACQKCREPLSSFHPSEDEQLLCRRCQQRPRPYQDCIIGLQYSTPVAQMVHKLKYQRQLSYLKPLTRHLRHELEQHYRDKPWPEALLPVPIHWWKLRQRGFNQAQLIAKQLSRELGIPLLHRPIRKLATRASQAHLGAAARQHNSQQAYRIDKHISQQHIAVVDDVMTTGATVDAVCRVLQNQQTYTIDIWCIARTPAGQIR